MWPNLQFPVDLVIFIEDRSDKHFFWCAVFVLELTYNLTVTILPTSSVINVLFEEVITATKNAWFQDSPKEFRLQDLHDGKPKTYGLKVFNCLQVVHIYQAVAFSKESNLNFLVSFVNCGSQRHVEYQAKQIVPTEKLYFISDTAFTTLRWMLVAHWRNV